MLALPPWKLWGWLGGQHGCVLPCVCVHSTLGTALPITETPQCRWVAFASCRALWQPRGQDSHWPRASSTVVHRESLAPVGSGWGLLRKRLSAQ